MSLSFLCLSVLGPVNCMVLPTLEGQTSLLTADPSTKLPENPLPDTGHHQHQSTPCPGKLTQKLTTH